MSTDAYSFPGATRPARPPHHTTTTTTHTGTMGIAVLRSRGERFETIVLVLILLVVGGFAGAASFTHVHDWTMHNSPPGTGEWFGWANAVVSELVPIAALLVMRRRKRAGQPIGYPASLLIAALALSVTAQLAVAKPGISGGIVSVVPALAFAALAKLILGKTPPPHGGDSGSERDRAVIVPDRPQSSPAEDDDRPHSGGRQANDRNAEDGHRVNGENPADAAITAELINRARHIAAGHLQQHGAPITRDQLRAALRVSNSTASELLRTIRADRPALTPLTRQPAEVSS